MAGTIQKPVLGSATLPYPSGATIEPIFLMAEQMTLGGKTRQDIMARKYKYTMRWDYMSNAAYDALEAQINLLTALTFTYEKWPQSSAGVTVVSKLSARELKAGAGNEFFWSAVTLECTEVDSRI